MSMRNNNNNNNSASSRQQQQEDNDNTVFEPETLEDDDNAQPDHPEPEGVEVEDPLLLAMDDLEGRVVSAMDDFQLHPGIRTNTSSSVHEELGTLLRPVLEVAAFTGPSVARTYFRGEGQEGVEGSVDHVYERVISDLVLPVMLETAQSQRTPAKLCASLEFFRNLWKECHKPGSWLDSTGGLSPQSGPYGAGGSQAAVHANTPAMRTLLQRRQTKRLAREGEILRYWVQASIACTEPGVLTSEEGQGAVVSRGVIAAAAAIRPSLRHIAQRIKDTDDRGANRLFSPVMRMVEGVFKSLFLGNPGESIRSACIKFLEVVILCCSIKPKDEARRRGPSVRGRLILNLLGIVSSPVVC
jgi:symplekin